MFEDKGIKMKKGLYHHSEGTKRKISESLKGRKLSKKHIENMAKSLRGNSNGKGKKYPKELYPKFGTRGKTWKMKNTDNMSHIAWNKGLTKETDERVRNYSKTNKKTWNKPEYIQFAKDRRANIITPKKDTSIEVKIQDFLKELKIEFFTHQYIKEIKHGYQCDILIPSMNLIIECDGDYWHKYPVGNDIDHIRTSELLSKGFKVLRLWECDIKAMNLDDFRNNLV